MAAAAAGVAGDRSSLNDANNIGLNMAKTIAYKKPAATVAAGHFIDLPQRISDIIFLPNHEDIADQQQHWRSR